MPRRLDSWVSDPNKPVPFVGYTSLGVPQEYMVSDQRFAATVAAFGQKLKGSAYGETLSWQQIIDLANGARGTDPDGYRAEFVGLVKTASRLQPDQSSGGTPAGGAAGDLKKTSESAPSMNWDTRFFISALCVFANVCIT